MTQTSLSYKIENAPYEAGLAVFAGVGVACFGMAYAETHDLSSSAQDMFTSAFAALIPTAGLAVRYAKTKAQALFIAAACTVCAHGLFEAKRNICYQDSKEHTEQNSSIMPIPKSKGATYVLAA